MADWEPGEQSSVSSLAVFSRAEGAVCFPQPLLPPRPLPIPEGCMFRHNFKNQFKRACEECTFGKGRTLKSQGCQSPENDTQNIMKSPVEVLKKQIRFQSLCLVEGQPELPNRV